MEKNHFVSDASNLTLQVDVLGRKDFYAWAHNSIPIKSYQSWRWQQFSFCFKRKWWGQTMGVGVNSLLFCFSIVCDKRNWFRCFAVFQYEKETNTIPCSLGTEKSNLYVKMRKRNRLELENKDQSSFKEVLDECDELEW